MTPGPTSQIFTQPQVPPSKVFAKKPQGPLLDFQLLCIYGSQREPSFPSSVHWLTSVTKYPKLNNFIFHGNLLILHLHKFALFSGLLTNCTWRNILNTH